MHATNSGSVQLIGSTDAVLLYQLGSHKYFGNLQSVLSQLKVENQASPFQ